MIWILNWYSKTNSKILACYIGMEVLREPPDWLTRLLIKNGLRSFLLGWILSVRAPLNPEKKKKLLFYEAISTDSIKEWWENYTLKEVAYTLRVCTRSLIVFNGSDSAAKTSGVWRSSDIDATTTLWNLLIPSTVSGGMESFRVASSCWLRTSSQSCNVCNQINIVKLKMK